MFVPAPLILSYYTGLAVRCSADDKSRVWTVAMMEHVYMVDAMLVVNFKDRSTLRNYTLNPRFDHLSGVVLF